MPQKPYKKERAPYRRGILSLNPHRADTTAVAASGRVPIPEAVTVLCVEDQAEHVRGLISDSRRGPIATISTIVVELFFPIVARGRHEYLASVRACDKYAVHAILLYTLYGTIFPQFIQLCPRRHAPDSTPKDMSHVVVCACDVIQADVDIGTILVNPSVTVSVLRNSCGI